MPRADKADLIEQMLSTERLRRAAEKAEQPGFARCPECGNLAMNPLPSCSTCGEAPRAAQEPVEPDLVKCQWCGCLRWEHSSAQKQPGQACICMSCPGWERSRREPSDLAAKIRALERQHLNHVVTSCNFPGGGRPCDVANHYVLLWSDVLAALPPEDAQP